MMHTVSLEKTYFAAIQQLMELFSKGVVFKLTSADEISLDFIEGGSFNLKFNGRGVIFGMIMEISAHKVELCWNVEGFGLPVENDTKVVFNCIPVNKTTRLVLLHQNIKTVVAARAKEKAWKEILEDIESHLNNS